MPNRTSKIHQLDGFRGIAVLMVFIFHGAALLRPEGAMNTMYSFLTKLGWIGVDLFFILSGFLITRILLSAPTENFFKIFWKNRFLRILPAYLAFVAAGILLGNTSAFSEPDSAHVQPIWYVIFLSNIVSFNEGLHPPMHMSILWSVAVEQHFYIFWPVIIRFLPRNHLIKVIILMLAVFPVLRVFLFSLGYNNISIYVFTFTHIDSIIIGGLIAALQSSPRLRVSDFHLGTAAICLGLFLTFDTELWSQSLKYTLVSLGCAGVFLLVLSGQFLQPLLTCGPLTSIGKISYSFYLWHFTALIFAKQLIIGSFGETKISSFGVILLGFVLTLAISQILWRVLEKPILQLK